MRHTRWVNSMYYILPFFLFVSVVITNFFYSVSASAVEGAVDSISKNLFVQSVKVDVPETEIDDVDDFYIDYVQFEQLFVKQFSENLGYYKGEAEVSFAYYNVKTQLECNHQTIVCNGVQVRIRVKSFSLIPAQVKYIRYEVHSGDNP